jgi:hypothetical protein
VLQLAREWREHDRKHHSKKADSALVHLANALDLLQEYERTFKEPIENPAWWTVAGSVLPLVLLLTTAITGCMSSSSATTKPPNDMPTAGSSSPDTLNGIFTVHDSGTPWEVTDSGLVMLSEDASAAPDAQEPLPVDASTPDAEALPTIDAGHDAGPPPPPPGKTCDLCTTDADCAANYACRYRTKDEVTECFLLASALPMGTSCYDLGPMGHLTGQCLSTCTLPSVCAPHLPLGDGNTTCAQWKAAFDSDY